ncbi:MAG: GNAT family N-acetyltransferase, partial [Deltaproteobacteria bacterium]|nr:GNAT family N-acetyltransferase [Deltaproteobacteria bacterium]
AMTLELDPRWTTLRDYSNALRKSYRRELRIARDRLRGIERRELDSPGLSANERVLNELRDQVLDNAVAVPARKDARCLALLKERLGSRCSIVGYFRGSELVAFNTRFRDGLDYESHYFGMDYQANRQHSLYRNMLYDDIEHAITARLKRVHFGRCSHESKSAVGAQPLALSSYVRHPSFVLTKLVVSSARRLAATDWKRRHPFKRSADTSGRQAAMAPETRVG